LPALLSHAVAVRWWSLAASPVRAPPTRRDQTGRQH
jgi:hypothetical protein